MQKHNSPRELRIEGTSVLKHDKGGEGRETNIRQVGRDPNLKPSAYTGRRLDFIWKM